MQKHSFPELRRECHWSRRWLKGHVSPRVEIGSSQQDLFGFPTMAIQDSNVGCVSCSELSLSLYWCYIHCVSYAVIYNESTMRYMGRYQKRVHAARLAVHFSSINCNLSPSPSKNVVCNSDPVQWGTIEAWVAPSIVNTFHVPVTSSSAMGCGEWVKARW